MTTDPVATLFEIAVYNAVSKKPRPGRPLSRAHCYLNDMLALKRMVEYWKDPDAYAAERERDERIRLLLSRPVVPRRSAPPSATHYLIFGNMV